MGEMIMVTDVECPDCGAEVGEWCFDWESKYQFPPYQHRKVIRGGALLAHSSRRSLTTREI